MDGEKKGMSAPTTLLCFCFWFILATSLSTHTHIHTDRERAPGRALRGDCAGHGQHADNAVGAGGAAHGMGYPD